MAVLAEDDRTPQRAAATPGSFGQWLRQRRKALDLTQEALGQRAACSAHTIRKLEAGERHPSPRLAQRLAAQLHAAPGEPQAGIGMVAQRDGAAGADRGGAPARAFDAESVSTAAAPFVGRVAQARSLRASLAQLTARGGHAVLIEGEAGIGKTRLIAELCEHALRCGIPAALSKCHRIEHGVDYGVLTHLIEQAIAVAPAEYEQRLDAVARAELALLVPQLATRWVDLPQLSPELPQVRKARLHAAVGRLFDIIAEPNGLLLVVDDLQWLDDASVQALNELVATLARRRSLVVMACRNEDLNADARLQRVIADLQASGQLERLALPALSRAEVQELMLAARAARAAPGDTGALPAAAPDRIELDSVYAASHGNPLFVVAALAEGHRTPGGGSAATPLPADPARSAAARFQAVVRDRLDRLSAPARRLLEAAAAIGQRADVELLQALLERPELNDAPRSAPGAGAIAAAAPASEAQPAPCRRPAALDELLLRQWLVADHESAGYTFAHDVLRENVLAELSSARREMLHARIAAILARRDDPQHALIAEHHEAARQWLPALRHRLLAGAQAERFFAVREAVTHYSRGVDLAQRRAGTEALPLLGELMQRRGLANAWLSQVDPAAADLKPVIAQAMARGDAALAVDLLTTLGMTYQRADRYAQGAEVLEQALLLARETGDAKAAALAMFWLGDIEWARDDNAASRAWFQQVMELCLSAQLGDEVLAKAHHGLGQVATSDARPAQALAHLAQSGAIAQRMGDQRMLCRNQIFIGWAHLGANGTAQFEIAIARMDEVVQLAERADMPWYHAPALIGKALGLAAMGRVGEALECFGRSLAMARAMGMARFEAMVWLGLAECCLEADLPELALRHASCAQRLMDGAGVAFFSHQLVAIRAQALIRLGRLGEVPDLTQVLQRARQHLLGHAVLRTLETQTEWHCARGDLDAAERVGAQWTEVARTHGVPEMHCRALAWEAHVQARRGAHAAALATLVPLLEARAVTQRFGLHLWICRVAATSAHALGLPAARTYGQSVQRLEAERAQAQQMIQAFPLEAM